MIAVSFVVNVDTKQNASDITPHANVTTVFLSLSFFVFAGTAATVGIVNAV